MRASIVLVGTALICLFLFLASDVRAQPDPVLTDGKLIIHLNLKPTDYLKPISRGLLLPDYSESIPGNRVQMFMRCFFEQDLFFGKAETDRRDAWNKLPLNELPVEELKDYGSPLLSVYAYDAARMTHTDWQLWYFLRRDGYRTILPEMQRMRALASAIKTRTRGKIASGDFPGAIQSLKTMFSLSRTLDSQPTLIGQLIGIAIGKVGTQSVQEFIEQPLAPNLYWALADLPRPFISLRLGAEGERLMFQQDFADLKSAEESLADGEIHKLIERLELAMITEGNPQYKVQPGQFKNHVRERINDPEEVERARRQLAQTGIDARAMQKWTPQHIIMLEEVRDFERNRDEVLKWMNLPFYQAKEGLAEATKEGTKNLLVKSFLHPLSKVKTAQVRLDQSIACLQVIEAIRLHAFQNGGALPATLDDMKLPLPQDPVTGKPFHYSIEKGVATLHGDNAELSPNTLDYFEIRLIK